ncbi:MAG: hypothetical protein WA047_09055 [Phenylobacterium sp.]|jgi:hypothetical protein|uniref:hypothetical protein n=1 Tax=Phenylobacterium sp. TaxID=1871053 RepID=UPI003BB52BF3
MGILNQDKAKDASRAASDKQSVKDTEAPHARKVAPLKDGEKPDQLAHREHEAEDRQEALLDEGLEESFPGSDPVSVKRIT